MGTASFNDRVVREVDFCSGLEHAERTLAEPLRDLSYFRQVRIDGNSRTIVWSNGLDPDLETLHGDFDPVRDDQTSVARPAPTAQ
ncbi:MAG: DUF2442 domain-containing protein [Solirubrobacterales bacterium]|nr:DUF2442 domain-containing protein [Solirubrobacterales bacterium]